MKEAIEKEANSLADSKNKQKKQLQQRAGRCLTQPKDTAKK